MAPAPHPSMLAALALLALASAACVTQHQGVRRLPQPKLADVAMARRAALERNWELAASAWYEIYLRNDENAPQACCEAARALAQLGDTTSARNLLEQGLKQFPGHLELLEAQGNLLVEVGFRRAAEPYFEQVLEREPGRLSALLALARLRVDLGQEEAALPLLEQRVALGASDADTWLLTARARRAMGAFVPALEAYQRAFLLGESRPDRLVYAASLYMELGRDQRALFDAAVVDGWLRLATEVDPQNTVAHAMRGELSESRGDLDQAQACYTRAVESDPAHLPSLRKLAKLLRKRGDLAGAAKVAERAQALEKDEARKAEWQRWIDEAAAAQTQPADRP